METVSGDRARELVSSSVQELRTLYQPADAPSSSARAPSSPTSSPQALPHSWTGPACPGHPSSPSCLLIPLPQGGRGWPVLPQCPSLQKPSQREGHWVHSPLSPLAPAVHRASPARSPGQWLRQPFSRDRPLPGHRGGTLLMGSGKDHSSAAF